MLGAFEKIELKSVILVFLLGFFAASAIGVMVGILIRGFYVEFNPELSGEDLESVVNSTDLPYLISLPLGLFIAGVCGYILVNICEKNRMHNVLFLGIMITIFSVGRDAYTTTPFWFFISSALLIVPACYLGGTLANRKKGQKR